LKIEARRHNSVARVSAYGTRRRICDDSALKSIQELEKGNTAMSAIHRSSFLLLFVALIGTLQIRAHDEHPAKDADPTVGRPLQDGWRAHAENPCLSLGELRRLAAWNDPSVLKQAGGYVMYLTTSLTVPGRPPVQPFRAVSTDGLRWQLEPSTPLIAPGTDPADFDFQSVETPSVVFFQSKFHLYYTGVRKEGLSGPMAIGHATSDDGIHWTKDSRNPVVRPAGNPRDFNGFQVAEPGAVVRADQVYLYFSSVGLRSGGNPPAKRVIALAKSTDGSSFAAPKVVLEQGDLYPPVLGFDG